jgi:serum/glucocorticoid-regulated kinase 2
MLEYLHRLVLQKFDSLGVESKPDMMKNFAKDEIVLFSLNTIKVNQRNWKQTRQIVITSKGYYNFSGSTMRRKVDPAVIRGVFYSSKSYEVIVHIPSEYDYHYICNQHMEKLIYYIYLCKQLQSREPVELVLVKIDVELISNYAIKEKQKPEEDFRRLEGVPHSKEMYKSKIKFELFSESFCKYLKAFPDVFNPSADLANPQLKQEFSVQNILPLNVLNVSKVGRVLLVKSKNTGNTFALKYLYRWKLVNFNDEDDYLKIISRLSRLKNYDNVVKYKCVIDSSSLLLIYMEYYQGGNLLFHMRRLKTFSEDLCRKLLSQIVHSMDELHQEKKVILSKL